jgi:hypothetical protein
MYVARIAFAAVLALLAMLLVASQILLIVDHESIHVLDHIGAFGLALCIAASAFYYFRSRTHWEARLACPSCRHRGSLRLSALGQPRISITAWILGGIIGSLLYSHARTHRFHCDACNQSNDVRTPGGWLAAAWLLLLIFALGTAIYVHGNG